MAAGNNADFRRSVAEAMRFLGPRLQAQQMSTKATPDVPIEQAVRERLYGKRRNRA